MIIVVYCQEAPMNIAMVDDNQADLDDNERRTGGIRREQYGNHVSRLFEQL